MKRALLALCTLALVLGAAPAQADHASGNYYNEFNGNRWNETINEEVWVSPEFDTLLTDGELNNALDTMSNAIGRWVTNTDLDSGVLSLHALGANFSFENEWEAASGNDGAFCNAIPEPRTSSIQLEDFRDISFLDDAALGIGVGCDTNDDSNNRIDYMVVVINSRYENSLAWWWQNNPTENRPYDFHGLFMHEFGHGLGSEHMASPCSHVTENSYETMCNDAFGHTNHTWSRTLETHDIGAANQAYPP